ncbi:MAG: oxidoreductase [Alphaproteobacteria bacterium]|nr:oxidoreductase [Alphaproteobacteria bacterium]
MTVSLSSTDHVVIVGASHGGISMAEQLRKHGFDGMITMLDRETSLPMERPPLSKAWLAEQGAGGDGSFLMRQAEWYKENRVEFRRGADAVTADPKARTLTLSDGDSVSWDQLVLATGATPRALPMAGGDDPRVHVLRVPADAESLSAAMTSARSMVIIGGGYIGLEVAASARKRGLEVTVIEMAPRLLARVASPEASAYFHALHESHGTGIRVGAGVQAIDTSGDALCLDLGEGEIIRADLVVAGIGVVPDLALAASSGVDHGNGITVDDSYRTSVEGIWAIGDVARCSGGYTRGQMRIESVHHAQMSAEIAAASMMGEDPKAHEVPWFWSEQYDKKLQSAGFVPADAEVVERKGRREGALSFWSFQDGALKAVEAIGDGQAYMLGKTALTTGHPVTPGQIADPEFDLKSLMTR